MISQFSSSSPGQPNRILYTRARRATIRNNCVRSDVICSRPLHVRVGYPIHHRCAARCESVRVRFERLPAGKQLPAYACRRVNRDRTCVALRPGRGICLRTLANKRQTKIVVRHSWAPVAVGWLPNNDSNVGLGAIFRSGRSVRNPLRIFKNLPPGGPCTNYAYDPRAGRTSC